MRKKTARTERDSGVQDTVVLATLKVIGRMGLAGVTHRAVADEAGLSLGAVTYYCRTRDDLVDAALQSAVDREARRLEALSARLKQDDFTTAPQWIEHLGRWYADELKDNADVHLACYEAFLAAARSEKHQQKVAALQQAWERTAEVALTAAGISSAADRAGIFVAALMGILLEELALPRRGTFARVSSKLTRLIEGWT
ncbi:TetR family transcriptional regulator [Bradyrhizobium sp. LHD-71]|uniref:TetR/AcrR family transcriptional regulator n=1 Tax=Bradyrhizobium sp. LHD-71 TaxID=3072141 RepID=UPI00280CEDB9|nr:TetR family transcriptional regulator [Bradyrhizobium sp. LHD-71]MDQ8729268.1 TetR family transcriptional regulator [Bradyrhizobium sp. LHD-71]